MSEYPKPHHRLNATLHMAGGDLIKLAGYLAGAAMAARTLHTYAGSPQVWWTERDIANMHILPEIDRILTRLNEAIAAYKDTASCPE